MNSNVNVNMDEVVEILSNNNIKISGNPRKDITSIAHLTEGEIKAFEYLLQFPESIEFIFNYIGGTGSETRCCDGVIFSLELLLREMYYLGYRETKKPYGQKIVTNISEIEMTENETEHYNILKRLKPDIEQIFLEAFNLTHEQNNPFRVHQCFGYLKEVLANENIELLDTAYQHEIMPSLHIVTHYLCEHNHWYIIMDSENYIMPYITIYNHDDYFKPSDTHWYYHAGGCIHGYGTRVVAEAALKMLEKINIVANFPVTLRIERINVEDFFDENYPYNAEFQKTSKTKHINIPRGSIGKCKKVLLEAKTEFEVFKKRLRKVIVA